MKRCGGCKEAKPLDRFGRWCMSKDGLNTYCKECWNARCRKWNKENPETMKARNLLRYDSFKSFVRGIKDRYNMTIEQFDETMLNQGGMCAICDSESKLVIDHDHTTGKVRQLLCSGCNLALGGLKDSIELAAKAGEYLKKHKSNYEQSIKS